MQENITKVIERGERLDDLQDKSGWYFSSLSLILPDLSILGFHYLFLFLRFPVACMGSWVHNSDTVVSVLELACSWENFF